MDIKVDFSGRAIHYTEEEIAVAVEAMRSAEPLTQGRHMREFESKFARYQGVEQGSCFTAMNGASALEMSAQLCLLKPGDEIVMPSHTFTASAYPYVKKGAVMAWADIDLHTRVVTAETVALSASKIPITSDVRIFWLFPMCRYIIRPPPGKRRFPPGFFCRLPPRPVRTT